MHILSRLRPSRDPAIYCRGWRGDFGFSRFRRATRLQTCPMSYKTRCDAPEHPKNTRDYVHSNLWTDHSHLVWKRSTARITMPRSRPPTHHASIRAPTRPSCNHRSPVLPSGPPTATVRELRGRTGMAGCDVATHERTWDMGPGTSPGLAELAHSILVLQARDLVKLLVV